MENSPAARSAESKQETSFCEQKEAKKLYLLGTLAWKVPMPSVNESFLLLFFKKEALSFYAYSRPHGA
jgi:hypothetical protein